MKKVCEIPSPTEGEIKRAVSEYLQFGQNQGKWWFSRLNSGSAFVKRGDKFHKIQLCDEGTADFIVIRLSAPFTAKNIIVPDVLFLELKSAKARSSPEQEAFKILVESQGASYFVVRSFEELEAIIEDEYPAERKHTT